MSDSCDICYSIFNQTEEIAAEAGPVPEPDPQVNSNIRLFNKNKVSATTISLSDDFVCQLTLTKKKIAEYYGINASAYDRQIAQYRAAVASKAALDKLVGNADVSKMNAQAKAAYNANLKKLEQANKVISAKEKTDACVSAALTAGKDPNKAAQPLKPGEMRPIGYAAEVVYDDDKGEKKDSLWQGVLTLDDSLSTGDRYVFNVTIPAANLIKPKYLINRGVYEEFRQGGKISCYVKDRFASIGVAQKSKPLKIEDLSTFIDPPKFKIIEVSPLPDANKPSPTSSLSPAPSPYQCQTQMCSCLCEDTFPFSYEEPVSFSGFKLTSAIRSTVDFFSSLIKNMFSFPIFGPNP